MPPDAEWRARGGWHAPDSIPRAQFHLQRRLAPRPAFLAAQPPFEVDQASVPRSAPRQRCRGDFSTMPAHPAAHPDHMPDAQVLKPEGITGRQMIVHVQGLFLSIRRLYTLSTSRRGMGIDIGLRLGPRQSVQCGGLRVAIASDVRKAVCFFGTTDPKSGDVVYGGTGFLVAYNDEGITSCYLVTCRHVAEHLDIDFFLRANTTDGSVENLQVESASWQYHHSDNVDIAATDILLNAIEFDHLTLPLTKIVDRENVACGQRIHIVGLFRLHFGNNRNVPIVHTGHIAALADPNELVPVRNPITRQTIFAELYLVEAQTLEGLSGSPVFIQEYKSFRTPDGERVITGFGEVSLLGVYQSAWDARPGDILAADRNLSGNLRVPVGMGTVVPIERLVELIKENEVFKKYRSALKERALAERAATMDAGLLGAGTELTGENPDHREDFTRLVSAAAKKRPPADQT